MYEFEWGTVQSVAGTFLSSGQRAGFLGAARVPCDAGEAARDSPRGDTEAAQG